MTRLAAVLLAAALASGCAAAPATSPSPRAPAARRAEQPRSDAGESSQGFYVNPGSRPTAAAPGITVVSFDARDPERAELAVRPASLDLASLPSASLPEPLDGKKPPKILPRSKTPSDLRMADTYSGGAYFEVQGTLARLLIGNLDDNTPASSRIYRACQPGTHAELEPARWMTLAPNSHGKVVFRVVDAWFSATSCQASVVRVTEIEPAPLLGGLVYAFRNRCERCAERDALVLLMPPISGVAMSAISSSARVGTGSFVVAKLSLRRGAAASFGGPLASHVLEQWFDTLGGPRLRGDALVGVDVTHAVGEAAPTAIAYATLIRR